jgi:tetratricopeptide (TPR) repeat protein
MPRKGRKVNVELPGMESLEIPAGTPAEAAELMRLMQKAYNDPDSLTQEEFAAFMGIAEQMSAVHEASISPEDRKQSRKLGMRAFKLWKQGNAEEAFDVAQQALRMDEMEPVAMLVVGVMAIEDDQEAFEAMGAVSAQVDFELPREKNDKRIRVLREVAGAARIHGGIAAYQCGHFESACGPLSEALDSMDGSTAGTAALFLVPSLIGDDKAEDALELIGDAVNPHPIMDWGRVLALLSLNREGEAKIAFSAAMNQFPWVFDYLVASPLSDSAYQAGLAKQDQEVFAAHVIGTLLRERQKLDKALRKLAG